MKTMTLVGLFFVMELNASELPNDVLPFIRELHFQPDFVSVSVTTDNPHTWIMFGEETSTNRMPKISITPTNEVLHVAKRHEWISLKCLSTEHPSPEANVVGHFISLFSLFVHIVSRKTFPAVRDGSYEKHYLVFDANTICGNRPAIETFVRHSGDLAWIQVVRIDEHELRPIPVSDCVW